MMTFALRSPLNVDESPIVLHEWPEIIHKTLDQRRENGTPYGPFLQSRETERNRRERPLQNSSPRPRVHFTPVAIMPPIQHDMKVLGDA